MATWRVLLQTPTVSVISMSFVCVISMILSHLHPNSLLENKTMFCCAWLYISNYNFVSILFTTLVGRERLLESFSRFQSKTHRNPAKLVKILPLIALILDIYKSWQDFNIFAIIVLYFPGFYIIHFIYAIVEMLEMATNELKRLNRKNRNYFPEKHYHSIYKAICDINSCFGTLLYSHVLLTTSTGLFFSYTQAVNIMKLYKNQNTEQQATYAPDFWSICTMVLTFSLTRAAHRLKRAAREVKRVVDEEGSELQLWQLNYEKMEVWAWNLFTMGYHVLVHILWSIGIHVLVLIQMQEDV